MAHNASGKTKVTLGDKKPSTIGKRSVGLMDHNKGKAGGKASAVNNAEAKFADTKFTGKLT